MMNMQRVQTVEFCRSVANSLHGHLERRSFSSTLACFDAHQKAFDEAGGTVAANAYHTAAQACAAQIEYPRALRLARKAEAFSRGAGDYVYAAEIIVTIGKALRDMGKYKPSRKAFQDAESIYRRHGNAEGQCRSLNLLAGVFYHQKDFCNALSVLMDAVEIARKIDDRKKLAFMMGNIGRIQLFMGDLGEAEKHLKINIDLSGELQDTLELARAWLSLAYLYMQKGEYVQSETALDTAYQGIVTIGSKRDEVIYLTYLGELKYRIGDFDLSRKALDRAISSAGRIASQSTLLGRALRHLAELHLRTGSNRSAQQCAARGITIMRKAEDSVELGALYKIRAMVSAASGKIEQARKQMQQALDLLDDSGVRWEKADALVAAGACKQFDRRTRLTFLFRAEECFARARMTLHLERVGRLIASVDGEMNSAAAFNTAGSRAILNAPVKCEQKTEYLTANRGIQIFLKQLTVLGNADLPLLLTGETGVGKDHLAQHFHSLVRSGQPFVAINCASLPETLLESELFGYRRGAFTGAEQDKKGLFAAANGGMLFLDEIGEMPHSLQAKLLGVLERRRVTPLGDTQELELDFLLVAATNANLELMVEEGRFRRDLYYRLSGLNFRIPALRERKEDIILLAERFMRECGLLGPDEHLPSRLAAQFISYAWPGNIRELYNRIKRLEVMRQMVSEGDLGELAESLFGAEPAEDSVAASLFERVEEFERRLIRDALLATGGNKSQAARLLGIHEATVRTKLKRYGIDMPSIGVN